MSNWINVTGILQIDLYTRPQFDCRLKGIFKDDIILSSEFILYTHVERISNKRHRDVCETVERMKNERKEPWKGFVEAVNGELCPKQM